MSICILILVGSSVGKIKNYIGCNTKFKGLLKYWNSIDRYIIDQIKNYVHHHVYVNLMNLVKKCLNQIQ